MAIVFNDICKIKSVPMFMIKALLTKIEALTILRSIYCTFEMMAKAFLLYSQIGCTVNFRSMIIYRILNVLIRFRIITSVLCMKFVNNIQYSTTKKNAIFV
jgi:hypothetical protein